jgi:hypothetical protein
LSFDTSDPNDPVGLRLDVRDIDGGVAGNHLRFDDAIGVLGDHGALARGCSVGTDRLFVALKNPGAATIGSPVEVVECTACEVADGACGGDPAQDGAAGDPNFSLDCRRGAGRRRRWRRRRGSRQSGGRRRRWSAGWRGRGSARERPETP